jgi:hypothetical protein
MGRGILRVLLRAMEKKGEALPDSRNTEHSFRYPLTDALKSAFAVFFFQHPSGKRFSAAAAREAQAE